MGARQTFRFRNYTASHNDNEPVIGWAECRGDGACGWDSGDPTDLDTLTKDMGAHLADTGHAAFLRHVTHHAIVTPGKWDGE